MTVAVLGVSALLALLLTEPGHEQVRAVLADAAISTVKLGEVVGHLARNEGAQADIRRILDPLPFEPIPFGEELAYAVGMLLPATRAAGLSFGDRACLALAQKLGTPALTADRAWPRIARSLGITVKLTR